MKRGRPESKEKSRLLDLVYAEYGLDAAKKHGFKAALSLRDLRKLHRYAVRNAVIPSV